jgi:hypothetical protein
MHFSRNKISLFVILTEKGTSKSSIGDDRLGDWLAVLNADTSCMPQPLNLKYLIVGC